MEINNETIEDKLFDEIPLDEQLLDGMYDWAKQKDYDWQTNIHVGVGDDYVNWYGSVMNLIKRYKALKQYVDAFKPYKPEDKDAVNPEHYKRAVECIVEMQKVFGKQFTMDFCLGCVWKYRYRAFDKGCRLDIEKSDWYMQKYIELKENGEDE